MSDKRPALPDREHAVSITLSDGAVFLCYVEPTGAAQVGQDQQARDSRPRWTFEDARGNARVGPIVNLSGTTGERATR